MEGEIYILDNKAFFSILDQYHLPYAFAYIQHLANIIGVKFEVRPKQVNFKIHTHRAGEPRQN